MKNNILSVILLCCCGLSAQNNFQIAFSLGNGSAMWKASPIEVMYSNIFGEPDTTFILDTHGNCPTIAASLNILYQFNRLKVGAGFTAQHYFLNELITEANGSWQPTLFTATNDPQPTHFKFYPHIEYAFIKQDNFELFAAVECGAFLTHDATQDSIEAFHWFGNAAVGLNYKLNENLFFMFAPTFDYSRFNTILTVNPDDQKVFYNIYSFYFSAGIKCKFAD